MLTGKVHPSHFRLLAQYEKSLDKLAQSGDGRTCEMVHSRAVCLLATAVYGHIYRKEAERSLANVYPSHGYHGFDFHQLWLPSN
jgi:hypothetical protein